MGGLFSLEGRLALVTGSARGLGHVMARGLAEAGARVVLSDVDEAALARAVEGFRALGHKAEGCPFDVSDEAAVEEAVQHIERTCGPIDILINNAGIQRRAFLMDMPIEDWDKVMRVNLSGVFLVGRAVARHMKERGRGRIVNISSINASLVRPGIGNYCAAKGGVVTLTKSMATEWGPYGITVNAIGPGYFLTELTRPLAEDPAFDEWVRGEVPLRRWGNPEELIGLAVLLAGDGASYISGQTIYIDGGWQACL